MGGARRRVVVGLQPLSAAPPPCQCSGTPPSAPLAPAKTDEQADNSNQGLRRTVCRLFCRVFLPKDLPEPPACVRHRWRCLHSKTTGVQSAWPPEHITGGNARGIPRAIGRGSPLITARPPEILGAATKLRLGQKLARRYTLAPNAGYTRGCQYLLTYLHTGVLEGSQRG